MLHEVYDSTIMLRILQISTTLLQKYYGITTAPLQHYGLQSLHYSTCHYSDYGDYGFRGKIPQFADVV